MELTGATDEHRTTDIRINYYAIDKFFVEFVYDGDYKFNLNLIY